MIGLEYDFRNLISKAAGFAHDIDIKSSTKKIENNIEFKI